MEGKNRMEQGNVLDGLHEECGVFGIYDFDGGNVASSVYYGLLALQHRGQESCGIAVGDTDGPRKVTTHKGTAASPGTGVQRSNFPDHH